MTVRGSPLSGVRVVDLSRVLAGPWCTQNLADLGADVIKVERPRVGDDTRGWGPPYLKNADGSETSEAAYYLSCNRNKRSIEIDLSMQEGAEVVRKLVLISDVLVENYKVGGLKKYGLDYDSLKKINPRLIYCSVTGFGQSGPYSQRPGYDFAIQGMGGLMSITGERDDLPGGGPQKAGIAVTDIVAGMYASVAVLGALVERNRSGLGQHLDIALLDSHVAMLSNQNSNYFTSGKAPRRAGNAHQNVVPYQTFAASDGHLIVAVGNDSQFRAYATVLGAPELGIDPRYATNSARIGNRVELIERLTSVMKTRSRDEWLRDLEAAGVPCGPINDISQVFADPQVRERGLRHDIPHPLGVLAPTTASPLRLSETPVLYRMAPPLLGEHTHEVLRDLLQMDDAEIERVKASADATAN